MFEFTYIYFYLCFCSLSLYFFSLFFFFYHYQDFVTALSILLRGSITEKLQWTFNLYDINRDGYINKEVLLNQQSFWCFSN